VNSENELPHQRDARQQPTSFLKPLKPSVLFVAVFFIVLMAGTGGYLLGMRNNQSFPPSQPSPSPQARRTFQNVQRNSFQPSPTIVVQSSVFTPSPISTQTTVPMNWKTYTNNEFGISFNYPTDWGVSLPYRYESSTQPGLIADIAMGQTNVGSAIYVFIFSGDVDVEAFIKDVFKIKGHENNTSLSKRIINTSSYSVTEYIVTTKYNLPTISPLLSKLPTPKPVRYIAIEKPAAPVKYLFYNILATDQIFDDITSSFKFTQ
jgi:hypothetical protein